MESKNFLKSKIVWLNLAALAAGLADIASTTPIVPAEWLPYIVAAGAVVNLVLRVFFTAKPLTLN